MLYMRIAVLSLPVLGFAGCSGGTPQSGLPLRAGCEEAVGQGVAPGKASARLLAQTSLTYQAQDLKGFMLKDGYRAVRAGAPHLVCTPYPLGLGLTLCLARAQLCGR
ncbi:MAG: hypothetical protein ABL901_01435 [Hyphomicrobiaceae bacterium]